MVRTLQLILIILYNLFLNTNSEPICSLLPANNANVPIHARYCNLSPVHLTPGFRMRHTGDGRVLPVEQAKDG
jgi:hypothetical protein